MNAFAKPNLAVDQIPSASAADKDKVLTIGSNGVPVWAENQGGHGGGGGVTIVHDVNGTLDMTAGEILAAAVAGVVVIAYEGDDMTTASPVTAMLGRKGYAFTTINDDKYTAASADDYPSFDAGEST